MKFNHVVSPKGKPVVFKSCPTFGGIQGSNAAFHPPQQAPAEDGRSSIYDTTGLITRSRFRLKHDK